MVILEKVKKGEAMKDKIDRKLCELEHPGEHCNCVETLKDVIQNKNDKIERLEDELKDWRRSARYASHETGDHGEKHCCCVGPLRKMLHDKDKELAKLYDLLEEVLRFLPDEKIEPPDIIPCAELLNKIEEIVREKRKYEGETDLPWYRANKSLDEIHDAQTALRKAKQAIDNAALQIDHEIGGKNE